MKFLFCSLTSPGFLFPLMGIATELRNRGHHVAFASGTASEAWLKQADISRIARGEIDGDSFRVRAWALPLTVAIDVKHIEYAITRFEPDVLVTHQLCQAPLIVKERLGLPVAVLGFLSYLWPAARRIGPPPFPMSEGMRQWRLGDSIQIFNRARELFGLRPSAASATDLPLLGDLFMLRTVPELERDLSALPDQVHAVGACMWEPAASDAELALKAELENTDAPVVYAQQGRTFGQPGFWPTLVDALRDKEVRVVASAGRMDESTGRLPENFFVADHVSQALMLSMAHATISGGNSSVLLGALTAGLPSVIIPAGGETPDNAERLSYAGCGLCLPMENLNKEALVAAVDAALEHIEVRQKSDVMRRAFAHAGNFASAVRLLELLSGGRHKISRAEHLLPDLPQMAQ